MHLNRFFLLSAFLWLTIPCFAQKTALESARTTALHYLQTHPEALGLEAADVAELRITDAYTSDHNGLTHVWVQQLHRGVPVFNALFGLHVTKTGEVLHTGHRFVAQLAKRVNTTQPSLGAARALSILMPELGYDGFERPALREKINDRQFLFESGAIARAPIPIAAVLMPIADGSVRLAWTMTVEQADTPDAWVCAVDAQTGQILYKHNRTLHCQAGHPEALDCPHTAATPISAPPPPATANAQYNVFALPAESPSHGSRSWVEEPQGTASPYGWHDVNGAAGAEYAYTRGNNAWAYDDSSNDNSGSEAEAAPADANRQFDFPFDQNAEPTSNRNAAITNLFYMTNMMHDLFYGYGFDEKAGNYQVNNYGKGGFDKDHVNSEALDGSGNDNANFDPTADGFTGRMQMYTWSKAGGKLLQVTAPPGPLEGLYSVSTKGAGWGPGGDITDVPLSGSVIFVNDGSGNPLGCNPPLNDVKGKIAMMDRGSCEFGRKALNVQEAGAIACVICNTGEGSVSMGPGAVGSQVTIPVVMLKKSACDRLRQFADGNTLQITLVLPNIPGPGFYDGSFDNGIIAHEYGHGISNRLTGGPNTAICLQNGEQMGEGWSDWFSLVTTVRPADSAAARRGIGTYVLREPTTGAGIRSFPYSTDMSINPLTYEDVIDNSAVHPRGEVWAATLWDLYWAMVEKYGYDPNWENKNSGNARAVFLVMDGMKLQPCGPGFLDGRNAILKADTVNYQGADACLIWDVFARRGMGFKASQGSRETTLDAVGSFEPLPDCVKSIILQKQGPRDANPGDVVDFSLVVRNNRDEAVANVVLRDELPDGLSLVSASNGGTAAGNNVVWNIGTLTPGQQRTFTYKAKCDPSKGSVYYFKNPMDDESDWITGSVIENGANMFELQSDIVRSGSAFAAKSVSSRADSYVELNSDLSTIAVTGEHPALRFWSRFESQQGADGGIVEVRPVGDVSWQPLRRTKGFRGAYPFRLQYSAFAIPQMHGFTGTSKNAWVESYFDLSDFKDKTVAVRFRFGTNEDPAGSNLPIGTWYVDDVETLDVLRYDGEACVTGTGISAVCAKAPEGGVIIGKVTVPTEDVQPGALALSASPNPADERLNVSFGEALSGDTQLGLYTADGRLVFEQTLAQVYAGQTHPLSVAALPAGIYWLRVEHAKGNTVVKVVVE